MFHSGLSGICFIMQCQIKSKPFNNPAKLIESVLLLLAVYTVHTNTQNKKCYSFLIISPATVLFYIDTAPHFNKMP